MSYYDFFCQNKDSERINGTCCDMCPLEEVKIREKENLVHVLETWHVRRMLVKSFSRSAADSNMVVPQLLRPFPVLMKTLKHLLLVVIKRSDVPIYVVYDFINDRIRSMRQDMTIQRLSAHQCVCLLEPMVRFYVYYGYRLCHHPPKDFDPVLNKKYLLECIKWLLSSWDTLDTARGNPSEDDLTSSLLNLQINTKFEFTQDRALMESLYIMCNLEDVHPLFRYINLPKQLKEDAMLRLAYEIAISNVKGNYVRTCRLADSLCPLTYCSFFVYLPVLQRRALRVLSAACGPRPLPLAALVRWLRLPNSKCEGILSHYGLQVQGDLVSVDKSRFQHNASVHQHADMYAPEKLDLSMDNIFSYRSSD